MLLACLAFVELDYLWALHKQVSLLACLTNEEYRVWQRFGSSRRRREYVGARLAAKLAFCSLRGASQLWNVEIVLDSEGRRFIGDPKDAQCFLPVSISHDRRWAAAIVSLMTKQTVGLDILDVPGRSISVEGLHMIERFQAVSLREQQRCWALKEAAAKATGLGLNFKPAAIVNFTQKGFQWLALPAEYDQTRLHLLSASVSRHFVLAIAFGQSIENASTEP
jgi:phosphopantetheinyl transferase